MAQENVVVVEEAVSDVQNGGSKNGKTKSVSFSAMKPQFIFQASKASDAIQFYKSAFGAEELNRVIHPKRKADQELPLILSAELKIASSIIIISDQTDESPAPVKSDGTGYTFCLETSDVDGAVANAVKAGAKIEGGVVEGESAYCGVRVAKVRDPYGYVWSISSGKKMFIKENNELKLEAAQWEEICFYTSQRRVESSSSKTFKDVLASTSAVVFPNTTLQDNLPPEVVSMMPIVVRALESLGLEQLMLDKALAMPPSIKVLVPQSI